MKFNAHLIILLHLMTVGTAMAQPKVIIKLDDLGSRNNHSTAEPVLDLLLQRKIKAGLGVIAKTLDSTASIAYGKYLSATNDKGEKLFEIWDHGYDHSNNNPSDKNYEFKGTGYAFQKEHLAMARNRVKELLGITMLTFGAPYNASDSVTNKVLSEAGYKVFLFGAINTNEVPAVKNFNNRVEMEITTGQVNFDHFVADYGRFKDKYKDNMVLQGHPNMWDAKKIDEFNKILDYLIAQKCEFVLPHDYYMSLKQ